MRRRRLIAIELTVLIILQLAGWGMLIASAIGSHL